MLLFLAAGLLAATATPAIEPVSAVSESPSLRQSPAAEPVFGFSYKMLFIVTHGPTCKGDISPLRCWPPFPNTRVKVFNAKRVQIRTGLTNSKGRLSITFPPLELARYSIQISHAPAFNRRFPSKTYALTAPFRSVNGVSEMRLQFCTTSVQWPCGG